MRRAAHPAGTWATPRYAQTFGHACVSAGRLCGPGLNNKYDATSGSTLGQTVGSQDCLYLNVGELAAREIDPPPRRRQDHA